MSSYQLRYWNQLKEARTHVIYLHNYAAHAEWWDRLLNALVAIASSSSIAAWAVWQTYDMLWAAIVAFSHVVLAVKPLLPYRRRLECVSALNNDMQEIALEYEKAWFSVAEGELTEKEIHELTIMLRDKTRVAECKHLDGVVLPVKRGLLTRAEKDGDLYLTRNYTLEGS